MQSNSLIENLLLSKLLLFLRPPVITESSLHLSGFLDDLGIVNDLIPSSNIDPDLATFNDMELSPIEDHARSLDMYYVPRAKIGPQDRSRNRQTKDKMLRQDRALK